MDGPVRPARSPRRQQRVRHTQHLQRPAAKPARRGGLSEPGRHPGEAPNAGRVVLVRNLYYSGNTVIVDHGLGVFSSFAHLSEMTVAEGESVTPVW